jgi:hypothetical protein
LDLLIGDSADNLSRAVAALTLFGAPPDILSKASALAADEFLFFGTPPARVDLLRSIPGVDFNAAFMRRLDVSLEDLVVHVISRDDLIAAKRAAGREKDLRDLRLLEKIPTTR